jgi:hypothetical protein
MTCTFFTIIKSYFRCCVTRDESADITKKNIYNSDRFIPSIMIHDNTVEENGEHSLFTFDDLSRPLISDSSSSSLSLSSSLSSSSSLDDYETKTTKTTHFQRAQAYRRSQFQPFIGTYYNSD